VPAVVHGYRQFVRACDRAGKESKTLVRGALREVGEVVRVDAARRFQQIDARSAAGYRVSVRTTGVRVVQSLRKTTGTRSDYGALQMRQALLPALSAKEAEVEATFELVTDKIADHFDRL
jgi:hypothetical protein